MAEQIFSTLRSQPFHAANLSLLGGSSTIDLSTANAAGPQLHATYDGSFVPGSDFFTIQLTFRNAPDGLISGTANEVHLRIAPRESGAQAMYYATILAAQ